MRLVEIADPSIQGPHITGIFKWWLEFNDEGRFVVAIGLDQRNVGIYWGPYCDDCRGHLAPIIERGKALPHNPAIESEYNRFTQILARKNSENYERNKCEKLLGERGLVVEERDSRFIVTKSGRVELEVVPSNPNERWYFLWAHLAYSPPIRFCKLDQEQLEKLAESGAPLGKLRERYSIWTYYLEVDRYGNILRAVGAGGGGEIYWRRGCTIPIPPSGDRAWPSAIDKEEADLRGLLWYIFAKRPKKINLIGAAEFEKMWESDRGFQ